MGLIHLSYRICGNFSHANYSQQLPKHNCDTSGYSSVVPEAAISGKT